MPKYDAVVADASPLISLEKLQGGFSLLPYTCSKLIVPEAVLEEVSYFLPAGEDYFGRQHVPRFVDVEVVPRGEVSPWQEAEVGELALGERYALAVAKARGTPLLAEERKARRLAREDGVPVLGAAGVVKLARDQGGITLQRAQELLEALAHANRISGKVLEQMLLALRRS